MRDRVMKPLEPWIRVVLHATFLAGFITMPASGSPSPTLSVSGSPITLFSGGDGCGKYDFVDAPARAFRDDAGLIHMFAAGDHNRQFKGTDFLHAHYDCTVTFQGGHQSNPSAYDDYGWLTAFQTDNGRTVHALVHNEYHGSERPRVCAKPGSPGCWETDVTAAISRDSGTTFQHIPAPSGLVAALPYKYDSRHVTQVGFFNPTNVVSYHGFHYVFIAMINPVDRTSGMCLLRTKSMSNPGSWRGWDGSGFNATLVDPYTVEVEKPKAHLCQPVAKGDLFFGTGSISHYAPANVFVATMRFNKWDLPLHREVPGVYVSTSKDLLDWSVPSLVLSDKQAMMADSTPLGSYQYYPSLLDPAASDRNFSEITTTPYLVTVEILPGKPSVTRHLVAWPTHLHFTETP